MTLLNFPSGQASHKSVPLAFPLPGSQMVDSERSVCCCCGGLKGGLPERRRLARTDTRKTREITSRDIMAARMVRRLFS